MNSVILIGRLTKDPELRYTQNQKSVCLINIAVNRQFSKEKKADYFRVITWGIQGENANKYLKKGSQCAVHGRVEINSYKDKEGITRYTTEIISESIEFLGSSKKEKETAVEETEFNKDDDFPMIEDSDVPF